MDNHENRFYEQKLKRANEEMYDYFVREIEELFKENDLELDDFLSVIVHVTSDLLGNLKESKKIGKLSL